MQREILFHILLKLSNSCGNRISGHYGVSDTASDRKLSLTPKLNGSNMEVQLGFLPGNTELIWEVGRNDDLGQFNQILEWSPFRSQCFRSFIVERSLDSSVVVCGDFMLLGFAVIRRSTTVFDTSGADVSAGGCSSPSIHRCAPLARGWFRSSRALSSHTSGFARVVR